MKIFVILLGVIACELAADNGGSLERLIKLTDKTEFLQYKENADWIQKSPTVTYVEKDQRDIFGNRTLVTVTGYDCDQDGNVDEPPKCAILYRQLQAYFATH